MEILHTRQWGETEAVMAMPEAILGSCKPRARRLGWRINQYGGCCGNRCGGKTRRIAPGWNSLTAWLSVLLLWPLAVGAQPVPGAGGQAVRLLRPAPGGILRQLSPPREGAPRVVREQALESDTAALRAVFSGALPVLRSGSGAAGAARSAIAPGGGKRTGSVRRQPRVPLIELQLFPDTVFLLQPDRVLDHDTLSGVGTPSGFAFAGGPRGRTISGVLTAGGRGVAILSEYEGALSASVRLANGEFYEVELLPGTESKASQGTVRQIADGGRWPGADEAVIPAGEEPAAGVAPAMRAVGKRTLLDSSIARFASGERIITVAAYYTSRVFAARGGTAGLFAYLRRVEEESNLALRNSGLDLEYRFVSAFLVEHNDTAADMSYSAALSALRTVYDASVQPRARLAALFVNPPLPQSGSFTVGIAYLRTPFNSPQRHSVTHQLFAGGLSLTFAHEAGHNFGCVHDVNNGGGVGGMYGDSRGYQQTTSEPRFYTVMAYSCTGCLAVPYYSDPGVLFEAIPVGSSATRCAATIAREAADVTWQGAPPLSGCIVEVYPSVLSLSPEAQDVQVEVRTGSGCAWQLSAGQGGERIEDLDRGADRAGPGWLRLRVPANTSPEPLTARLDLCGVPLVITQNAAGSASLRVDPAILRFEASTQPDTVQERCLFVAHSPGNAPFVVRTAGLPPWLTMDRSSGDAPGWLCARVNPRGLASGQYRAAVVLSANRETPADLLLTVELRVAPTVEPIRFSPRAFAFRASASAPLTGPRWLEVSGPPEIVVDPLSGPPSWLRVEAAPHREGLRARVWVDASGLEGGVYLARLLVGCAEDACAPRVVPVRLEVKEEPASGPRIAAGGIVNAASFTQGLSVGSWMSMFGENLASSTRGWTDTDFLGILLPVALDQVRVLVDGIPAAISFVSAGQINFQCPELERQGWVPVEVVTPWGRDEQWAYVEPENPGVFLLDSKEAVAALHEDTMPAALEGSLGEVPARSARPGDVLSLYATGFGPTQPRVPTGVLFQGAARIPGGNPVRVTIGGMDAEILFAGQSGAGLNQINLRVPGLPPGDHPVRVVVGASPAPWRGTLRVRE